MKILFVFLAIILVIIAQLGNQSFGDNERICDSNSICIFPGDFLKFSNSWISDNYNPESEFSIVFGEYVNSYTIRFSKYGFYDNVVPYEKKYLLNLETGTSLDTDTQDEEKFFQIRKIPLNHDQIISTFFPSKIREESKKMLNSERTVVIFKAKDGSGELWIDKESGVQLQFSANFDSGNGLFTIRDKLINTNIFDSSTMIYGTTESVPKKQITTEQEKIPDWIKQVAEFWIADEIDDSGFVQVIEYLVQQRIITIPYAEAPEGEAATGIPIWIKTTAEFWVNGDVLDDEFATALEWLINNGIIRV